MKIQYIILMSIFMLSSCYSVGLLKKEQYIKMSDNEIKNILLQYTPIGCTKIDVKIFIKKKLKVGYSGHPYSDKSFLWVELAHYGGSLLKGKVGYFVRAYWYFNKNNVLEQMEVKHAEDTLSNY